MFVPNSRFIRMSEKQPIVSQPGGYQQGPIVMVQPEFGSVQGKIIIPMTGNREWSTGLFECTKDITNCMFFSYLIYKQYK